MKNPHIINRISDWLETRWLNPAYGGWLLAGMSLCFFGAAINTMAGWLYVMSGISFSLLMIAAILPVRSLRELQISRRAIPPVTAGDQLTIEINIENSSKQPKTLLQVRDVISSGLGKSAKTSIETIPPESSYKWIYYQPTEQRGVYHWQTVQMRTGTPLGLFWCRRHREVPIKAIVYPTVLPLTHCPLVDDIGQDDSAEFLSRDRRSQMATAGITRGLRPYRMGDPTRLIHWRTSARYGELKVRELEIFTGGQELIICLDSRGRWNFGDFEQAVIAAASLYFYANRAQLNVKLWTAHTGLVHGNRVVLETLAATYSGEEVSGGEVPNLPLLWLTQNPLTLNSLPQGSRWMFWTPTASSPVTAPINKNYPGIVINSQETLQLQMQLPINRF